jgi:hypothetical protein
MPNTTKLGLPLLTASQSQKHVTHNEAINKLDILVQLNVLDRDLTAPPGSPVDGACYIVGSGATGAWATKDLNVAAYQGGAWSFFAPDEGWMAWVVDEDMAVIWTGAAWQTLSAAIGALDVLSLNNGTVTLLGINGATADTTNRLSMNALGALFNHAGAGFNMTLNKAATGDTLSQTWQTGFSTRAILGLIANNDFAIRTSANGSTFFNALTFTAGSGRATFAESLLAGNGSATVPAFTFASDTNTGIYSIGADQLGISVGGTLRLTVSTTAITVASSVTALNATSTNISALYLGLGGATADATNRLSINTPAVLLNHAGTSIDMTFNKNAAGNDASLSFKTGFSSRALVGLLGSDDFTIKVSPDGSAFFDAMVVDEATGTARFPNTKPQIDEFNTAGTFTWTKPAWANRFVVLLVGGGGGGGGGASGNNTAVRAGGGGGGAGAVSVWEFSADEYASTCTVIVGAGGTAGASATTANGGTGGTGGTSEFRLNGSATANRALTASGGTGGKGGSTTGTGGAGAAVSTYGGNSNAGGNGGTASAGQVGASTTLAIAPGGGGGGGGKSTTPAVSNAGAGGVGYAVGSTGRQATGGTAGGTGLGGNGGANKTFAKGAGAGGGGGGAHLTNAGGAGGAGGNPGGGGGGGGASLNAVASGAGGVGGVGMAVIISYAI